VREDYAAAARHLGDLMVSRGLELVYGGGRIGLMGVIADAVLARGGRVTGVIPKALMAREQGHEGVTELHRVDSMHERKSLMGDLADAFVAMPGGLGTLEELFEVVTWAQLGIHPKPCAVLNVAGYFDPLIEFLDHQVTEGFVQTGNRGLILVEDEAEALLDRLATYRAPAVRRWLDHG
jgi:hypothetical protein